MNRARIVRAMDEMPGSNLDCVYDRVAKRYLAPANLPTLPFWLRVMSRVLNFTSRERVAIVDTGFLSQHPHLRRRIVGAEDFTGEGPEDRNGHGTAVALVFLSSAPGARLLNVKVLDQDAVGTEEDLIEGLRWAENNGAGTINISLGITRPCDGSCAVCHEASRLVKRGILVVAAAGNYGPACPAQSPDVLSVGGSPTVQFKPVRRWGFF